MNQFRCGLLISFFCSLAVAGETLPKAALSDEILVQKISALPMVDIPDDNSEVLSHAAEIRRQLKEKRVVDDATVQSKVVLNRISSLTHESKYSVFVISLRYKLAVLLESDDLWLVAHGKKNFKPGEREMLNRLVGP